MGRNIFLNSRRFFWVFTGLTRKFMKLIHHI